MALFGSFKEKAEKAMQQAQQAFQQQTPASQQQAPYSEPTVEADDDDDDDYQRDYNLEAQDDTASFDIGNDIEAWWVALFQIEEVWEEPHRRMEILHSFQIRDEQHFYQVQATVDRFINGVRLDNAIATDHDAYRAIVEDLDIRHENEVACLRATAHRYAPAPAQRQRFGHDLGDISQLQANALMAFQRQKAQARVTGELAGELTPVEGITIEQWAHAQARAAAGHDLAGIIGPLGIDQPTWDRVSAEWIARISRDTTATLATVYGHAFSQSGQGQFADAAAAGIEGQTNVDATVSQQPPIPLERWVEIGEAMSAYDAQGGDPAQLLASYGLDALAWSNASAWWSTHFSQNAMKNSGALFKRHDELSRFYRAHFTGSAE